MSETLILASVLAFIAETMTEYLAGPIVDAIQKVAQIRLPMRYVAAGVGIALAFAYRLDFFAASGFSARWSVVGVVLSGLVIGRGSNYIHDLTGRFRRPP